MSDLLTREEYGAIAKGLTLPVNAFIDGSFRPAHSGATFETVNPATGTKLADVASCDAKDVDFAVEKARDAFEDGRWSRLHPSARKDVLIRLCKLLTRNAHELAVMESLDSGKPLGEAEGDVGGAARAFEYYAAAANALQGESFPLGHDYLGYSQPEPVGITTSASRPSTTRAHTCC